MNCPHWLLALTIPFSRSDRAHACPRAGVGAGCPEGLVRTKLLAGESPSAAGGPGEAVPTGVSPYQTHVGRSTRTDRPKPAGGTTPPAGNPSYPHDPGPTRTPRRTPRG